jgi:hypothetical protein
LAGATIGLTALRCSSCLGGSIAMNIGRRSSGGRMMVMPPKVSSTRTIWWLTSTCMMSLYLVTDQYGPNRLSLQ